MSLSFLKKRFRAFAGGYLILLTTFCSLSGAVNNLEIVAVPHSRTFMRWEIKSESTTEVKIERSQNNGIFEEIALLPAVQQSFVDSELNSATEYRYRFTALPVGSDIITTDVVTAFPRWNLPLKSLQLEVSADNKIHLKSEVSLTGRYTLQKSENLSTWESVWENMAIPDFMTFNTEDEVRSNPQYYRLITESYPVPQGIGLNEPFQYAAEPNPSGSVYDVTDFGASPIVTTNNDSIGIETAISVAKSGDIIFIPEGVYTLRDIITIPSGITVRGAGKELTTLITEGISRAITIEALAHDIRLESLAIKYEGSTEELDYGVYIGSSRQAKNSYRIHLNNLKIEGFSVHGVSLRDCNHVLVENCEILNATNLGGGGHGYGIALNYPTNHNNWIRNNTIGPVIRHSILLQYYAHNNLIEHNLAQGNSEDCYDLHGEDEYANELRYNTAQDGERDGFGVGNTGATHDRSGMENWIHHNTVRNCLAGIEVIQASDSVYIDHNTFENNTYGVRVHDGGGQQIYIRGNIIHSNQYGVAISAGQWIWIENNDIRNQSRVGIQLQNSLSDIHLDGNVFVDNAKDME